LAFHANSFAGLKHHFLFFTLRRGLRGLLFICNHLDFAAELVAVTVATSSTVLC
jgi:hypothetical protein